MIENVELGLADCHGKYYQVERFKFIRSFCSINNIPSDFIIEKVCFVKNKCYATSNAIL